MDIYAEAHHTTAIFYQVIIDLHQTLCTVCSKDSLFPLLPKLSVEGKEKLGLVWLLLGWGFFFFLVLFHPKIITNPTDYTISSHQFILQNIPQLQRSKKLSGNGSQGVFCVEDPKNCRAPRGALKEQQSLGVGKKTLSILLQCPKWTCSTPGVFLGGSLALAEKSELCQTELSLTG